MCKWDWHKLRDLFWPMLEKEESSTIEYKLMEDECAFANPENIDRAIDLALHYAKNEDDRRASVETKAALFVSAFSLAVTILISMVKDFILNMNAYPIALISTIIVFISIVIIYLCRATLYAIDALSKRAYSVIGIPQFMYSGDKKYKEKLFLEIRNSIYSNFGVINQKVDSMTMAQEFFKCAVRTVILLAIIISIFFVIA